MVPVVQGKTKNRNANTLVSTQGSMNCGRKARKKPHFGFSTVVRTPCRKCRRGRAAAERARWKTQCFWAIEQDLITRKSDRHRQAKLIATKSEG